MEKKFTLESPMPPGWIKYPNLSRFTIGWRMGYGEYYVIELQNWLETLSEEDQKTYDEMFPEPRYYGWENDGASTGLKLKIPKLAKRYKSGEKIEYVFFWNSPNVGTVDKSCLGQCHPSKFEVDIDDFCCAEQSVLAEKARWFKDEEARKLILASTDPEEIKALGGEIRNFKQRKWDEIKYSSVRTSNYFKFAQNEDMRDFLLSTDDKVLVNADPLDTEMGIGLSETDKKSLDPEKWKGQNLLGFALMDVRDDLRRVYQNYSKIDWSKLRE